MAGPKGRGLGRGLESLFNEVEIDTEELKKEEEAAAASSQSGDAGKDGILYIDINDMKPNADQPRKSFNEESINELANSIEGHGIIQPIMVRTAEKGYEIVAGERRWRAARKAGLKRVPCIIRELDERENMLLSIIENMQREDLNSIEEAKALEKMIKTFGLTQEEVSKSVGKSRPYITNALRLLKLPDEVQGFVMEGRISNGHARAIAGIDGVDKQIETAQTVVEEGLSVRETENLANSTGNKSEKKKAGKAKPRSKNREITDIEIQLKDVLGTKVNIDHGPKKGKIEIEYYSREELERILELILTLR